MDCYDKNLDFFEPVKIETGVTKIEYIRYSPIGSFTSKNSPLIFEVPPQGSRYLDLRKSVLNVSFKIMKKSGGELTHDPGKGDLVTMVNLPLSSFFRQVDITVNNVPTGQSVGGNHPYRCFLDVILNSTKHEEDTLLQSELFYKDQGEEIDGGWLSNYGFTRRIGYSAKSRVCTVRGRLRTDITDQKKLILPGVKLVVKLYQAEDQFKLMSSPDDPEEYTVQITDACYEVCMVSVDPSILLAHAATLKKQYALYPLERSDLKTYNIQKGSFSFSIDNAFQGSVPSKLILCLCSSETFHGNKHLNPFNFAHYNVSFVEVKVDGVSRPRAALTPDFTAGEYSEAFSALYENNDEGGLIEFKDFAEGYCVYKFQLEPLTCKDTIQSTKSGNVHINLKFNHALGEGVTLIMYSKFADLLRIDEARNIYIGSQ